MRAIKTYRGKALNEIIFPLGGIGSGCIGLGGNGRLVGWEIQNRANKGSLNGMSHLAVKAEQDGKLLSARVLNGDLAGNFTGGGYGPPADTMAGFPHFADCRFESAFPFANLRFKDDAFPGAVRLTGWNPFIPLDEDASSLPAAFFAVEFHNPTDRPIDYTAAFSVRNLFAEQSVNRFTQKDGVSSIRLAQTALSPDDPRYGELTLATDGADVSWQENWFRGSWFDAASVYWRQFAAPGRLENRAYDEPGSLDHATLAVRLTVGPKKREKVRFVLTWHFPNNYNYWDPCRETGPDGVERDVTWKNYYAVLFPDSGASADYCLREWDALCARSRAFTEALSRSTLPPEVLDAASATLSVLKSPTVLRLEDGSFYGWEGLQDHAGSCEGSCTHVWNYAMALPFLFPRLERSMRDLDFAQNLEPSGRMQFRLRLPVGRERGQFRACVDGQMGAVIKTYRDWKLSGDDEWLRRTWPMAKRALEYAWSEENADRWDYDRDGVLEGRQHHTLDVELFGPSGWLEGFYLAALAAGAEMAEYLGEPDAAAGYRALFASGKRFLDSELFNGKYYIQRIDLADRSTLKPWPDADAAYWNDEAGEIKYQIGEGCEIDQLLAQWHANLNGIGEIFDPAQRRTALKSIYRNNHKTTMRDFFNPCRVFALNGEQATVICDYPKGAYKPVVPVPYCEEAMHGFEYAAGALMISEGLVDEGLAVVRAVRDRYDGTHRNPFDEVECGHNYARSMASWSLIPIFSGFSFDLPAGKIGFDPIGSGKAHSAKARPGAAPDGRFRSIWSAGTGWGTVEAGKHAFTLTLAEGSLSLRSIALPFLSGRTLRSVTADGEPLGFGFTGGEITLGQPADDCFGEPHDQLPIRLRRSLEVRW